MGNKKYDRKTPEQKQKELEDISAQALSQIEKYSTSPNDLLEYAKFMSKFHNYSSNNTALIQDQFEGAQAVASFKNWKDNGYSVNKGEKGIKILSYTPITLFINKNGEQKSLYSATKEEKELIKNKILKTHKVPHFKIGHVFDVSQTNCPPEELPKVFPNRQFNFTIEEGNNAHYLQKGIEAVATELNITVKDMKESQLGLHELGSAKGVFAQAIDGRKEILLNSRNTETQGLATAIHELAHARLHDRSQEESKFDRSTKEFQAELTSYIVCHHYGMDTSEKAIPYIASWTKNGAKIEDKQKSLEGVHRTSREFIEVMDQVISQEKEKDLLKESQLNQNKEVNTLDSREQFKLDLQELLQDDETMAIGSKDEVIYKIDDITIYGGFDMGVRGVDHNSLISDNMSWEDMIEWGTVVVPETKTYISNEKIEEFEDLGFNNLPADSNHIVGYKEEVENEDKVEPTVTFEWSESNDVPSEKELSLSDADLLLTELNKSRTGLGYDKTKFNIHYNLEGEEEVYQGRYDIGDERGGLVDHVEAHVKSTLEYGLSSEEERESYEKIQDNVIPIFREYVDYTTEEPIISPEQSSEYIEESNEYYPKNPEEVRYCELTGEPFSNLEPYYYVDGGTILSETAHSVLYTDEEWENYYNIDSDENYWTEEIYDLLDSELTDIKPKPLYNDIYYKYDPNDQTKPEKLGTISDIVSKASEQTEFDRFSSNRDFISDLSLNREKDKEEFSESMEKYNVLKNPNLHDFQRVNEKEGLNKNSNLEEMVQEQLDMRRKVAMQRAQQR